MRSQLRSLPAVVTFALGLLGSLPAAGADLLLSVSPGGGTRPPDPLLRTVDGTDGSTVDGASVVISLVGQTVLGATGLARDPQTETLYALLKLQGTSFRRLVTLDEFTGVATDVGDTGHRFAGLASGSDGTLYGVTGDGDGVPESLFTLSTVDGTPTLVRELGAGSDGETIAFNPDDGLLYHASGVGTPNHPNGEQFETIDPDTLATTNVPLSGFDYEELTALMYSDGAFLAGDLGNSATDMPRFFRITTGGVVTFLGDMDHVSKGLVPSLPFVQPVPALSGSMTALLAFGLLGAYAVVARRGVRTG